MRFVFLLLLSCVFCAVAQSSLPAGFDGKTWWGHVKVLAADDMEGRDTGSPRLAKSAALAAHYQSRAQRKKALLAAGALGYISIPNPASMDIPWSRVTLARKRPSMVLADATLDDAAGIRFAATFNPAYAQKLFEGSGHSFEEIAALGKDRN